MGFGHSRSIVQATTFTALSLLQAEHVGSLLRQILCIRRERILPKLDNCLDNYGRQNIAKAQRCAYMSMCVHAQYIKLRRWPLWWFGSNFPTWESAVPFLPLDEAIASGAVFVIVSGSDGRVDGRMDGNAFGAS